MNGAGNNTITFADEGDNVLLIGQRQGAAAALQWGVYDGTGGPGFTTV